MLLGFFSKLSKKFEFVLKETEPIGKSFHCGDNPKLALLWLFIKFSEDCRAVLNEILHFIDQLLLERVPSLIFLHQTFTNQHLS